MPASFNVSSREASSTVIDRGKSTRGAVLRRIVFCLGLALATLAQAQAPVPAPPAQPPRVIVKLRAALAQQAEAEFSATTPMWRATL